MAKLVRDKIPEIIARQGKKAVFSTAGEEEYKQRLYEKLVEEFDEFKQEESIEEMADVFEVLHHILALHGYDLQAVEEARKKKAEERGGFQKRIVLERSSS